MRPPSTHYSCLLSHCLWKIGKSSPHHCPTSCFLWTVAKVGHLTNGNGDEGITHVSSGLHSSFRSEFSYSASLHFTNPPPFLADRRFLRRFEVPEVSYAAMVLALGLVCHVFLMYLVLFSVISLHYAYSLTLWQTAPNKRDKQDNHI